MKKPTQKQMASLDKTARDLFAAHKITEADISRVNPFLQAFVIPISQGKTKIKSFANDLFHKLGILMKTDSLDFGMANHYCGLDLDEGRGCCLVIFNHPAIYDYPEDSPEGRCAYGVVKV